MARTIVLMALILLHACKGYIQASDLPAILEVTNLDVHAELVSVVSNALDGVSVILGSDVLMKSNNLIVERRKQQNLQGRLTTGRLIESPEQFILVINGSDCVLIRLITDARYVLKEARCRAL